MSKESVQKKLGRVRPPRVQITYDVEVGEAMESKELPFVLGVVGDFSGQPEKPLPRLKDRKFVNIDGENFDDVMRAMTPLIATRVDNTLKNDGSEMVVNLTFDKLADFEPQNIVQQVDPLKKLLEARNRLADLRNKMMGNEKLEEILDEIVRDTEALAAMANPNDSAQPNKDN
jgi:type VI secretion system protein ImpB